MEDTFTADLQAAQKAEVAAEIAFQRLRAVKMEEIQVASQSVETKSVELADTNARVAQAKEDVVSTKEALSADEKFLVDLEAQCESAGKEFDERVATRAEEVKAIAEAIQILSQDDARDIFSRTVSFLQVQSHQPGPWRIAAARRHWGTAAGWQLAELGVSAHSDGIEKVK